MMEPETARDAAPAAGNGRAAPGDEALAGRARRGDAAALTLLARRWQEPLRRYCRRLLRHEEDARDLAQDALLRAVRGLPGYDESRPFAPWMYRIARNVCLHHLEKERVRREPAPARPAAVLPPDVLVARREEVARVRAALAALPGADRRLLEMKLVEGLGNAEIAARLGLTAGALRTRASRALARLRGALDAEGGRT